MQQRAPSQPSYWDYLKCCTVCTCLQVERAKLEKAVEEELAAEAAADEEAKQQKREQIAAEERRLQELEQKRHAEVGADTKSSTCWSTRFNLEARFRHTRIGI
jgi:hypothetical protein